MKKSKKLLGFLLLLICSSCASIPDVPVCTRLDVSRGFCVWTVSKKEMVVSDKDLLNGKTWLDIVIESVYTPADSWATIKGFIVKKCKQSNACGSDVSTWKSKLDGIDNNL